MRPIPAAIALIVIATAAIGVTILDHCPKTSRGALAAVVDSGAPRTVRVVSKQGHPTHPTWYHDAQILSLGDRVTVAWNGRGEVRAAQLRATGLRIIAKSKINAGGLGGSTDSTGTDTDRHDVPAVVADAAGHIAFLYGGGSVAARGSSHAGPLARHVTASNALRPLSPERPLDVGGGAAFDFESATDRTGTVHLIGQHGRGNTGSLVELRLRADGTWEAPRELIHGGDQPRGCVLGGRPRGCTRFAIARIASDPESGRLHLVWGWSEASLSGKCRTDAGYCDHDLNYAYSDDRGATWHDAAGRRTARIAERPLPADAPAFRVVHGHVGLFKAVTVGRAGLVLVYSRFVAGTQRLMAARRAGGRWRSTPVAADRAPSGWTGSLVLRGGARYTLWTPTGKAIHRFSSTDGATWSHRIVYKGPAWSLTGSPAASPREELLLWRGRRDGGRSWVMLGAFPTGR
jgi:hypothetical protein